MSKRNAEDGEGVGGDPGRYRTSIKNTINTQDSTGRIVNKVEHLDLNQKIGHGCSVEPDPPDPFDPKGGKKK
jgi:hypothetical protein